jgi:hypothetical protein
MEEGVDSPLADTALSRIIIRFGAFVFFISPHRPVFPSLEKKTSAGKACFAE